MIEIKKPTTKKGFRSYEFFYHDFIRRFRVNYLNLYKSIITSCNLGEIWIEQC